MKEKLRSADHLATQLGDPKVLKELAAKSPEKAMEELKKMATTAKEQTSTILPDTPLYRMVIGFLGTVGAIAALGAIVLVIDGKDVPQILVALGSAAIGALGGILSPSPAK